VPDSCARTITHPEIGEMSRLLKNLGLIDLCKTRGGMDETSAIVRTFADGGTAAKVLPENVRRMQITDSNGFMPRL
jgi:hypothetical protein